MAKKKLPRPDKSQRSLFTFPGFASSQAPSGSASGTGAGIAAAGAAKNAGGSVAAADTGSGTASTDRVSPTRRITHHAALRTPLSQFQPGANGQLEPPAEPSLMTFAPREEPERGAPDTPPENFQAASAQQLARIPLNVEQTAAVHAPYNIPVSLCAGAGTGKTTTLTARIHNMIADGIPPSAWLHSLHACTFH
jgi:hypothetical protein